MRINIDGVELNYEIYGEGRTILFLHGFGLHLNSIKGSTEHVLKDHKFKRVYLDLPGMGDSSFTDKIMTSDDLYCIVKQFVKEVIGDDSLVIFGQSYGGYLAQALAYEMDNVEGLFLVCPIVVAAHQKRILPKHCVVVEDKDYLNSLCPQEQVAYSFCVNKSRAILERTKKQVLLEASKANNEFLSRIVVNGYSLSFENEINTHVYNKPTTILLGLHDSITGFQDIVDRSTRFKELNIKIYDKSGHNLLIEECEKFESDFKSWLSLFK